MEEKKLTAAEKGTVVHAVMQNISLQELPTEASIQSTLQEMLNKQTMTQDQRDVVDIPVVLKFFETEVGKRMVQARMYSERFHLVMDCLRMRFTLERTVPR